MRLFGEAVHGLHAVGVVEVDPVVRPVATGLGSVPLELGGWNVVEKDVVVACVVVGDLALVLGLVRRMNLEADLVDAEGFFGPFVVGIHVVESWFDEGSAVPFLVEHEDAAAADLAHLDFLALGGVPRVGLGGREPLGAFAAAPPFRMGGRVGGRPFGGRGLVGLAASGGLGGEKQTQL